MPVPLPVPFVPAPVAVPLVFPPALFPVPSEFNPGFVFVLLPDTEEVSVAVPVVEAEEPVLAEFDLELHAAILNDTAIASIIKLDFFMVLIFVSGSTSVFF